MILLRSGVTVLLIMFLRACLFLETGLRRVRSAYELVMRDRGFLNAAAKQLLPLRLGSCEEQLLAMLRIQAA
jgi:hypothetical protein